MKIATKDEYVIDVVNLFNQFPEEIETLLLMRLEIMNKPYKYLHPQDNRNVKITREYITTKKSYKEVGKEFSLTTERVRQIVAKILRRLVFITR